VNDPTAAINAIDILGHACDIEGFPRVVIEAMAAGKPVVGPHAGGVLEVVKAGDGILVELSSAVELGKSILDLVDRRDMGDRIGREAQEKVCERLSIQGHVDTMVQIFFAVRI